MTIHIPRRLILAVLGVCLVVAAGIGGYVLGRHSRAGIASQLALVQKRDAAMNADLLVHEQDTIRQLRNLCREVTRITPAVGSFSPATCSYDFNTLVHNPPGLQSVAVHHDATFQAIAEICDHVLQIQGGAAETDQSRTNCAEGLQPLPSEPPINLP